MGRHPAKVVKPGGAVCPLLIRLRRHFCRSVMTLRAQAVWKGVCMSAIASATSVSRPI